MKRLIVLLLFVLPLVAIGQGSRTPDIKFLSYCDEGVDFYRVVWNRTATDIRILNNVGMDFEEFIPSGNELPGECSSSLCIDSASYSNDTLRIYCGGDAYLTEIVSGGGGGPTLYTANGTIASEFRTVKYLFPLIFRSIYNTSGGLSGIKTSLRFQSNQVKISVPTLDMTTDSLSLEVDANNGIVGRIPRIFGVGTVGTLIVNSTPSGIGSGLTFNGSWHNNNTFVVGIDRLSGMPARARVINNKDGFTYGLQVWPGDTLGNSSVASLGFFNNQKGIYYEAIEDTLRLRVNFDNEGLHLIDLGSATSKINFIADQYAFDPTKLPTPYADDAAAGAAGLLTGRWYQTDGTGAAPLNIAGILMVKQ